MSASRWLEEHVEPLLDAGKRVLLVEGEDDQKVYETWFDKLAGGPGTGRAPNVVPTTGKSTLLRHLKALNGPVGLGLVFGIADRDEWDDAAVHQHLADIPGLRVNSNRHCLESYFCEPAVLKAALQNSGIGQTGAAATAYKAQVKGNLPAWVAHWSLWTTIQRLARKLTLAAWPDAFHSGVTLPNDATIKAKLAEWSDLINVESIMKEHRALRKASLKQTEVEQLRGCIYAKNVFPQIVLVELNKLKADVESDEWVSKLAEWMPQVPADIAAILNPLLV